MRIACIGNMNNMVFPICRYLLDHNFEVTLFLLDEYEHFNPLKKYIPSELKVVKLGWNESSFSEISKSKIQETFNTYSFFLGTDYSAAFLAKAGIRMDIYMPAGSDLFQWPFKKFEYFPGQTWEINKVKCARKQLFGIRHAKNISMDYTNEELEGLLLKTGNKTNRISVLPALYFKGNTLLQHHKNEQNSEEVSSDLNFRVMQHGRQAWAYPKENLFNKGNNILIEGFASFVNSIQNTDQVSLVLLEYGEHVEESKKLIAELGISKFVHWLSKMHRDELISEVSKASISVGSFNRSWLSYGAVYEALACKVAFMGYRKDELYKDQYPELYPMINANSAEEVAKKLKYYYLNRKELDEMGVKANNWLLEYAINPSVQKVLEIVKSHKGPIKLPVDWKLVFMEPYFWFVKCYNFFKIRLSK